MERRLEIADLLRRRVKLGLHAGSLTPGDRLPSTRELAADFRVDHRVVVGAYHQLVAEGLVEMRPRGGIYVADISACRHSRANAAGALVARGVHARARA